MSLGTLTLRERSDTFMLTAVRLVTRSPAAPAVMAAGSRGMSWMHSKDAGTTPTDCRRDSNGVRWRHSMSSAACWMTRRAWRSC